MSVLQLSPALQAFLEHPPFWAWLICGVIEGVLAYAITMKLSKIHEAMVTNYFCKHLQKIYFCHYSLKDVYFSYFFPRYRQVVDWGFCAPVAALSMLAFRDNPSARFICARAGKQRNIHCWMEFRYWRYWYVIDPCWQWQFLMPRRKYYRENRPEFLQICEHDEFWQYKVTEQMYEKAQNPRTSWLLWELMKLYRICSEDGKGKIFPHNMAELELEEKAGEHISHWLFYYHPEIIFSRRIMHQMMQHAKCRHLNAHRVRAVKWFQKQVKQYYDELLIKNHLEEYLVDRVYGRPNDNEAVEAS